MQDDYVTITQASEILGFSRATLKKWVDLGRLEARKLAGTRINTISLTSARHEMSLSASRSGPGRRPATPSRRTKEHEEGRQYAAA